MYAFPKRASHEAMGEEPHNSHAQWAPSAPNKAASPNSAGQSKPDLRAISPPKNMPVLQPASTHLFLLVVKSSHFVRKDRNELVNIAEVPKELKDKERVGLSESDNRATNLASASLEKAVSELEVARNVELASSLVNVVLPPPDDRDLKVPGGHHDLDLLRRLHWRFLEGYRCWTDHVGIRSIAADPTTATIEERFREILLWKVLVSLAEANSFSSEHLCINFHRTLLGANTRPDGSCDRPYELDLPSLHRGLHQVHRGEINIDDITYSALHPTPDLLLPQQPMNDSGTRHYVEIDSCRICFQWRGLDVTMAYLFRTHIDTQAHNLERMLGRYVPRNIIIQRNAHLDKRTESVTKPQLPPVAAPSYDKFFHNPRGTGIVVLILCNYFSYIIYKIWAFVFALSMANDWHSEHFFDSLSRADGICLIVQAILEIGCRVMLYRKRFFSSFPFNSVVTVLVVLCQILLVCSGTFMVTGSGKNLIEMRVDVPHRLGKMKLLFVNNQLLINLPLIYLLVRIGAFVLFNMYLWLSFTPLIEGSATTQFSLWRAIKRKMRFRTFATFLYWGITLAVCGVFEVKVLMPTVSSLTPTGTCACTSLTTCTYQASLQCLLTIAVAWLLVFTIFITDTHVAFVGLLSIIGLFVGVGSRLHPQDRFQLSIKPFFVVHQLTGKFLPPNADVRLGMRMWDKIIEEMYESDLISDGHRKQLKLTDRIPDEDWSIELPVFEAQERLTFFVNSLAMKSAPAPSISNLQSVSTIIPCYDENIVFSYEELCRPHYYGGKPGPTDIENLISVYPLEWEYFTSRMKAKGYITYNWTAQYLFEEFIKKRLAPDSIVVDNIRLWASYRGQTVARTIRGVTYYEKVLSELGCDSKIKRRKFQVLLSLQTYTSYDANKLNGLNLLLREFPHVEIVYEWDRDAASKPFLRPHVEKLSFLTQLGVNFAIVKEEWNIREQRLEVTEVLPRTLPLLLGPEGERLQGKALNQRNALMFAWAEVLQTLDANQDGTFEDALKIPCLLQYFHIKNDQGMPDLKTLGPPRYRIIGFREAVFTAGLTTVGRYMAMADFSFTTIFSRVLANPLSVRMHYGHPDFFDACWVMSRGALCKASPKINLNEDIFAGYTATLRNQRITHKEFIQMRKGREISLKLADQFDAKLAEGAAAQLRSSDLFELNQRLNFVKKISMFHGSIGFYVTMCIMAYSITLYVLALLLTAISNMSQVELDRFGTIYSAEFVIALGFVYMLPGVVEQFTQFGPKALISILLHFVPSSLFFGFLLQTKAHNFQSSLVTGRAQYRATGRKLTIERWTLKDLFMSYSESHFAAGARLLLLIALCFFVSIHKLKNVGGPLLIAPTILALTWILCPILFNPFPSFEGYSRDAKEMWCWLTRPNDLDLCALSYLHPKGDKKLGVPPQRDVEQDSWANWYVVSQCNVLATELPRKRDIFFLILKQALFLAALAIFVLGMTPTSLLCLIYLCLLGLLLLFALGLRKLLHYFAIKGDQVSTETLSNVFSILTVAACLALVIYFVLGTPITVASTFSFVDFAVAALVVVFVLRFFRGILYLIFGMYGLQNRPKQFISAVAFVSSSTLQMKIAWIVAVGVVLLQIIFGYFLSIFPQLHTSFMFNPNLATSTHGLDNLPCGSLRKLEIGSVPRLLATKAAIT